MAIFSQIRISAELRGDLHRYLTCASQKISLPIGVFCIIGNGVPFVTVL